MTTLVELLTTHRLLPVLTLSGPEEGTSVGGALIEGGLPLAEVTLRREGALDALRAMSRLDLTVGAGTVVSADQVDLAVDAGAAYVVSPGLHPEVVERCRQHGVPVLPGVATATDLMQAVALAIDTVKLFPAELVGGPAAVQAFASPFPAMRFVPTGGVKPSTMAAYLSLPSVLATGGSWLAPRDLVEAGQWEQITRRVRDAVRQIDEMTGVVR